MDRDFQFVDQTVKYTGTNEYISQWVNNSFIYKDLADKGFSFFTIDEVTYMSGIKVETYTRIVTKVSDILDVLGEGYSIVDNNGNVVVNMEEIVTTGYKVKKGNEDYLTIIVKGEIEITKTIDIGDASEIVDIVNTHIQATREQLIAADINNDGVISKDDSQFVCGILLGRFKNDEVVQIQNALVKNEPIIYTENKGYKYKWLDEEEDIIEKLTASGSGTETEPYTINEN